MLVPIPQRELIDEHRAQGKAARVDQPLGRHLAVHVEDALELFVEIFDRRERSSCKMRRTSTPSSVCG